MITEKMLRKWRKEALKESRIEKDIEDAASPLIASLLERIICMTQELLDQHLLRK